MITDSFDNRSPAKIQPRPAEDRFECAACVVTFSSVLRDYVLEHFHCEEFARINNSCGPTPMYALDYRGVPLAFYMTGIGAPFAAALLEEAVTHITTPKFVVFGGAGCLDKEIAHGKVMIPDRAYRDEGTSYHYAPPADYIALPNAGVVAEFMKSRGLPYVTGGTWTTDAFFRETEANFQERKAEGCISVEMECAALQAVCGFRGYELYYFLTSGDLLDAPQWDARREGDSLTGSQHDVTHFDIAAELACFVADR